MKGKMKLCIIIEGESAEELFAVGPNDLRSHFLPEGLHVKPEDVTQITFKRIDKVDEYGLPAEGIQHQENFYRKTA